MQNLNLVTAALVVFLLASCTGESGKSPSGLLVQAEKPLGKLFIIGGGERSDTLNQKMIDAAGLSNGDYIVVLPMSSEEPDSAFIYFLESLRRVSNAPCFNLNFTEKDLVNREKLDSLEKASLIFISGGDQSRFMNLVRNTTIHDSIKLAYAGGAMIAGTSAGAAMMSKVMITGDEKHAEEYESTYDKVWTDNAIYAEGLGLLDEVILDQHFVVRSRYNRLLTALCDYPGMAGVGIDESTAILVKNDTAWVVGESQVVLFAPEDSCEVRFHHLAHGKVELTVLLEGEYFPVSQ